MKLKGVVSQQPGVQWRRNPLFEVQGQRAVYQTRDFEAKPRPPTFLWDLSTLLRLRTRLLSLPGNPDARSTEELWSELQDLKVYTSLLAPDQCRAVLLLCSSLTTVQCKHEH